MAIAILQSTIAIPRPTNPSLSSVRFLSGSDGFGFRPISINHSGGVGRLVIRNGGGPRTFPGGVSKWQWKRMQAMKAKQLLKARLLRERQIYEMRKRAELKVAVSELEAKLMDVANYGERRQGVLDNALRSDGPNINRGRARDDRKVFQEQGNRSFAANGRSRNSGNGRRRGSNDSREAKPMAAANYGERRQGVFDNALSSDGSKITRGPARDDQKVSQEQGSQSFAANGQQRNGGNGRRRGFNGSFKREDAANYRGEEVSEIERRGRSRNGGNRRFKDERVSLRPTSDLYSEDDDF